jgi:uncharacterized repeat protein (TIGR01451 family)
VFQLRRPQRVDSRGNGERGDPDGRRWPRFAIAAIAAGTALALAALPAQGPAQGTDPSADLSVAKADSVDPVTSGTPLTYTVEVRNEGPDPAANVSMTDDFPAGVDFVAATSSTGSCERKGGKVTCTIASLANDEVATVTIDVTVTKKRGSITNSVSVQSDVPDPQAANNLDTEVTQVVAPPPAASCKGRDSTIVGTELDDAITGTDRKDVIVTLGGNDTVFALSGNDTVCGGPGDDSIRGALGADLLRGSRDDDVVRGGSSNDNVGGGFGRDRLGGGVGIDLLQRGASGGREAELLRSSERGSL